MKKHSRDYIKCLRRDDHHSSLKHLEVNIHKIVIIFLMEEYQYIFHLIIINWFDLSSVWIWNIFRVGLDWKLWRVELNITIINGMMIKSPHNSWNHRTVFLGRGPWFQMSCCRFSVSLSWWIIWFFAMKGVELIHISYKNWWEEFMSMDDAGILLMYNPST